jgi:hypothetical protein
MSPTPTAGLLLPARLLLSSAVREATGALIDHFGRTPSAIMASERRAELFDRHEHHVLARSSLHRG